jgi:hypothetical protein
MRREAVAIGLAILVVASLGVGYLIGNGTRSIETITPTGQSPTSTVTMVSTCVAPPPPVQVASQVGPSPLSIVGADTTCAVLVPAAPGKASLANFTLTLAATKPLNLTMVFFDNDNGVSSIPPGTSFTATDGVPNTAAAGPLAIQRNLANATLIAIPGGETTFHFQASVPNPFNRGTYFFDIYIFVSSKNTGGSVHGYTLPVNLDAQ